MRSQQQCSLLSSNEVLWLDFETFSEVDLKKCGADVYSRHASTRVLMLGWAVGDDAPQLWDAEEQPFNMPPELVPFLIEGTGTIRAHNAPFEIAILGHTIGIQINLNQWQCSRVLSYSLSFAGGLGRILKAIGMPSDSEKDTRGKKLIQKFCKPAPSNHKATIYDRHSNPEDWADFEAYCLQDVVVLRELWRWCDKYSPVSDQEWARWRQDREINQRGLPIDYPLVNASIEAMVGAKLKLKARLKSLTGLHMVTNGPLLEWLNANGCAMDNMQRATKEKALATATNSTVKDVLQALLLLSQASSSSKWNALDNRGDKSAGVIRETIQFVGAGRTGRAAGRGLQLQNLKRSPKDMDANIAHILTGAPATMDQISTSIRGAIKAPPGTRLVVSDLSSIESRVVGWLTDCSLINSTFNQGLDTYKVLAARLFNVEYADVTKEQRTFAKPAALGCFAADTLVLTNKGWVPIINIDDFHTIWDGIKWVKHQGVAHQGVKTTVTQYGVSATPDHRILGDEGQWVPWSELADESTLRGALSAVGHCSSTTGITGFASALVERLHGFTRGISTRGKAPSAGGATMSRPAPEKLNNLWLQNWASINKILTAWQTDTTRSVVGAITPMIPDTRIMEGGVSHAISTTPWRRSGISSPSEGGMLLILRLTESITMAITSLETSGSFLGRITGEIPGPTPEWTMKGVVTALLNFTRSSRQGIETLRQSGARSVKGSPRSRLSTTRRSAGVPTYDILNCGDLSRFTIWTDRGPVIAHNCQYMLGGKGLVAYADNYGVALTEVEAKQHVATYREIYPELPGFWQWIKDAIFYVLQYRVDKQNAATGYHLRLYIEGEFLFIELPSGRRLNYFKPAMVKGPAPWDKSQSIDKFQFMGMSQYTQQWGPITAHAGGILENIIQALARDVLYVWLERAEEAGHVILGSVHDEIITVIEEPRAKKALVNLNALAAQPIDWAPGLNLDAAGYISERYRKD